MGGGEEEGDERRGGRSLVVVPFSEFISECLEGDSNLMDIEPTGLDFKQLLLLLPPLPLLPLLLLVAARFLSDSLTGSHTDRSAPRTPSLSPCHTHTVRHWGVRG